MLKRDFVLHQFDFELVFAFKTTPCQIDIRVHFLVVIVACPVGNNDEPLISSMRLRKKIILAFVTLTFLNFSHEIIHSDSNYKELIYEFHFEFHNKKAITCDCT